MNEVNSLGYWLDIASYSYVLNFFLFGIIALLMSIGITMQAKRCEAVIYCLLEMIKFVGLSFSAGFSPLQFGLVISRTTLRIVSLIAVHSLKWL